MPDDQSGSFLPGSIVGILLCTEVMMKYLLILVLLVIVWSVLKKRRGAPPQDAAPRPDPAPEKMLVCAHCGVHMPESDALVGAGKVYCSEAHRSAAAKSG